MVVVTVGCSLELVSTNAQTSMDVALRKLGK